MLTLSCMAQGALKALDVGFNVSGERSLEIMPVQATLRQVLHEVSALDGAREIKEISMDVKEYAWNFGIPTDPAFACIVKLAQVSAELGSRVKAARRG